MTTGRASKIPIVSIVAVLVLVGAAAVFALGAGVVPLVCAVLVALMAFAQTPVGYVAPHSHGLPGLADGAPQIVSIGVRAHLLAVLLGGAALVGAAALDAPVAVSIVVLALVGIATWLRTAAWIMGRRHLRRLRKKLAAYGPTVGMAYAGRSGGPWQLRLWEPYILASGERNVVINVHAKYVPMILEGAHLSSPLIQLGSSGTDDLDRLLVGTLRTLYYVQNARTNAAFMTHAGLTHVWLNHGDSDKPANFNIRHALYDLLVVCGQAGIDRYEQHGIGIPDAKFRVLGRPQTVDVEPQTGPITELANPTVLYAPTWQGVDERVDFSSLEKGPEIVRALIERNATVIFRPHPLSYRWRERRAVIHEIRSILKHDRETSDRRHLWGKMIDTRWSVADCANRSDALVSDVSGVVSDFLASDKPYAMTCMRGSIEEFRTENAVAETAYVLLGDMSNLDEALDEMLFEDPMAEARDERRRYVLGDLTGKESAAAFADFVRELARTH